MIAQQPHREPVGECMFNLPNAITLLRFALIPAVALLLLRHDYETAFLLFIVSALSDLADGQIARRWNLRTRFGAIADPLADKLTMLTVMLLLTLQNVLPHEGMLPVGLLSFWLLRYLFNGRRLWACGRRRRRWATQPRGTSWRSRCEHRTVVGKGACGQVVARL